MRSLRTIVLLGLILALSFSLNAQHEGTASDKSGVVFFIESMPANQYRHKGTISCAMFSPDDIDPLLDHMIKQAKKEHEEFDAMIFRPGTGLCKADVISFYRDPNDKRRRGRRGDEEQVNPEFKKSKAMPRDGTIVYVKNNPSKEYTLLGKVETPVTFRSNDIEELLTEVVRNAKKSYPDLDAVVVMEGTGLRKASAIKYK